MEANVLTPQDLFDGNVWYEVPPFQRPYVWTEEDQWQPLWDDIRLVADAQWNYLALKVTSEPARRHFLGAVVLKLLQSPAGSPARRSVIDGQQRLSTLQIILDAAQAITAELGSADDAESLQDLVSNGANRFRNTPSRFKLWPSRVDRVAFESVMDNELTVPPEVAGSRLCEAHGFFSRAISDWAVATGALGASPRLSALAAVLQQHLQLVSINLSDSDDDQLIFETLNDRGTPLLAADLIKNYVFQRCADLGADVDAWAEQYWHDFDEDWWRSEVAQGRLFRSRIDLFLQYWLTMRLREEIPSDSVFRRFREYAESHLGTIPAAEAFLRELRNDADTFSDLVRPNSASPARRFYANVVEILELGAFIPLLLWLTSINHKVPDDEATKGLLAVESFVVRRVLLRRTMKDVNGLVVALLQSLDSTQPTESGTQITAWLASQTAESRSWPSDADVRSQLPGTRLYGSVKQPRLRFILSMVEGQLRSARNEDVSMPQHLEIEHIMPQGWRTFWGADIAGDPVLGSERDALVNTLGNLTLVTKKLNGSLSHRPWTDNETHSVAPGGTEPDTGKRSLLRHFSLLVLNKDVVDNHPAEWTEADIAERSASLTALIVDIWKRPSAPDSVGPSGSG